MVDWPGLLKWTLSQSDGTVSKPDIKPMDPETQKWLEEALESYSVNEAKRMKAIMEELVKPDNQSDPNEEKKKVGLLDELSELVEGLENARDLVRMGIYGPLIDVMLKSPYGEVRKAACYVFANCNSNNTFVQNASKELGAFQLLNSVLQEPTLGNKEAAFAALSSMIRGESLPIKRDFIDMEGIEFVLELLSNDNAGYSDKIRTKAMTLLLDLNYYDDKLQYKDIVAFNKGSGSHEEGKKVNDKTSQHISLNKKNDDNEEEKMEKQSGSSESQHYFSKYKYSVKKKLIEKGFIQLGLKFLSLNKNSPKALFDLRTSYFSLVISLIEFDQNCKPSKEYFDRVSDFNNGLMNESKQHEDFFEKELELLGTLLSCRGN